MLSTVERTLRERRLFEKGARVLVAVSGGPDSMALLHALWELRERWRLHLEVATVDHGLRPAAAAEVALVLDRCSLLGLPGHVLSLGLGASLRPGGVGIMSLARERRREALRACASSRGLEVVALGHQADDQIETVLFRLVRGTGLHGLGGMPLVHEGFVRPLLEVRRREILGYLAARSIPFVEDPSNADPKFARSRIRHQILPFLEKENPRVGEALLSLAEEATALRAAPRLNESRDRARRRRWRETLAAQGLHASRGTLAAMLNAAEEGGTKAFDLQGGRAEVRYGELVVAAGLARPPVLGAEGMSAGSPIIEGPGEVVFGPYRLRARQEETSRSETVLGSSSATVAFDADAVPFPWLVRAWRPGDRMLPRAGRGSRKLSDLFIDARIPRVERALLPVVTGPLETILFVPGLRPSETGRPTPQSRRLIFLETSRLGSPESSR